MRVCIFIDGQNFYRSLARLDPTLRVNYDKMADWVVSIVDKNATFNGAYYYVGISNDAPASVVGFLKGLEMRTGFFVRREIRVRRTTTCPNCQKGYEFTTEKRVDTRLVADMIHFAANGTYDAAVLVSGDDDFVPAVEAVHALGKQIWVATWSEAELSNNLRVRCFGHIALREGLTTFQVIPREEKV